MADAKAFDDRPDPARRKLLVGATGAVGGAARAAASYPFIASLGPSERAKSAGAPVEFDIAPLAPGRLHTLEWRGKPVWVLRRTPEMLAGLKAVEKLLSDPHSEVSSQQPEYARNVGRSINEETFVTVALCTHLGCIPSYYPEPGSIQPGWPGGFYCPCHGSKFDLAGRVFKGSPAPTNLEIPPYRYEGTSRLVVGADASGEA
ncbi:MAG TPA: ubiquinol-cytochrome c reductase iron-sulfur subunit [Candidatus Polarisedimenticolaceae bacterium]|nr:ubiquinol-cytochrome c reductase iron-sulfur subunit [Candidatus Polarisedimenticolaceae bacterium]